MAVQRYNICKAMSRVSATYIGGTASEPYHAATSVSNYILNNMLKNSWVFVVIHDKEQYIVTNCHKLFMRLTRKIRGGDGSLA